MSNTDDTNKTNPSQTDSEKLLNGLNCLKEVKPSCHSFWIPIVALAIIALLLFLPLKCSSQTTCSCSNKGDTLVDKPSTTIQFNIDVPSVLKELQYDTNESRQKYVVKSEKITIQPYEEKSDLWPLLLYRLLAAVILLLAVIFILKYLVPYWKKIVEVNEKQNERLIKIAEEQIEFSRLREKTSISIEERQKKNDMDEVARENDNRRKLSIMEQEQKHQIAMKTIESMAQQGKNEMDENNKDKENKRKISIMEQDYKTHFSKVVSEMVNSIKQSTDSNYSELITKLLEMLKDLHTEQRNNE
jgi:hypothetical protein